MVNTMITASDPVSEAISVWIVEDDLDYRNTVAYVLDSTPDFARTEVFYDYEEVQTYLDTPGSWRAPEVVLMDINLPGRDGIQGLVHLKSRLPDVYVVMLTVNADAELVFNAFRSGACGYLLKDTSVESILSGVRDARRGGMPMPPAVAGKVLDFFARLGPKRDYHLTPREKEVLVLMADGLAYKQIVDRLFVSPTRSETTSAGSTRSYTSAPESRPFRRLSGKGCCKQRGKRSIVSVD